MMEKEIDFFRRKGPVSAMKEAPGWAFRTGVTFRPIDEFCYRHSLRRLQSLQEDERDLSDFLDTAYQFSGLGQYRTIAPIQVRSELAAAAEFVAETEPKTVMEIGTANGGTFYTWCRGLESVDTALSVDLPDGSTPARFLDAATPQTDTKFLRGDSHTDEIRNEAERLLDGSQIDFLFIDGDHTFDGVKQDFELYEPLVSDDGMVAFHDIVTIERDSWNQVDRFWETLTPEYTTVEIKNDEYDPHNPISIAGTTVTGHGFGILQKDGTS